MEPGPHTPRNTRASKEKDKDNILSGKEKANHGSDEKGVKTSRTTRYKDKFTALRSKYEHVITQQQNYHRDLEAANAKTKKMQEEIDLLLEALMTTTPPAPSIVYLDIPTERNMHYSRPHGMEHILETSREKLNYFVPRDHPTDHENSRSTHTQANGETNGNPTNGVRRHSVEPESELNPNYMSRESNGRIPNS